MKKIALVGCGRIMGRHIEAIATAPGIEIAMVCDIDEAKAKKTAERLGVPYVTDYRRIQGVDVAAILTPSGLHPQHVTDIAEQTDTPFYGGRQVMAMDLLSYCPFFFIPSGSDLDAI
ncbi:MAG: Inositol 2-dehydrogenase/D-chiro-inositol 3-dehydrogenase [Verrucomicrobia bacterium ADurb.Bin018]|nr:MAG: Inositol 2-dehydrogenase/D-chiro-inositol 3-dehydrogenase [Verrucomicrobia bacterium ADurb.Bin018]